MDADPSIITGAPHQVAVPPGETRIEAADARPEDDLVRRAIRRDRQAFAALYDLTVDRVYRHIAYRTSGRADAEDLTQQVYLQAWRAIDRYRPRGAPFVAWLLTIAHNVVVSHYRRRRDSVALGDDLVIRDLADQPDEALSRDQDQDEVREAVSRLKPDQQQVIMMRFVDELEYSDVAAALGKSEGAIRVIQHRALHELRRLLGRGESKA